MRFLPGILASSVALIVVVVVAVRAVMRGRRRHDSRSRTRRGVAAATSAYTSGAPASESIALGQRIDSWTRVTEASATRVGPRPAALSGSAPRLDVGGVGADPVAARQSPDPETDRSPALSRRLAAPVELWFGTTCVGVVPGSDTHERFSRYANGLLAELPASSDSSGGGSPRV